MERVISARRRAAAKRKKLKHLGKSRSTDTEDEENEEEPEEGKAIQHWMRFHLSRSNFYKSFQHTIYIFTYINPLFL